jgi:hypothetical protein
MEYPGGSQRALRPFSSPGLILCPTWLLCKHGKVARALGVRHLVYFHITGRAKVPDAESINLSLAFWRRVIRERPFQGTRGGEIYDRNQDLIDSAILSANPATQTYDRFMTVFPILATTGYVQTDENMLPKWLVPCQSEHANAGNS